MTVHGKPVLAVVVGEGLDDDDMARLHKGVIAALFNSAGEPPVYIVTMDAPMDSADQVGRVMEIVRNEVRRELGVQDEQPTAAPLVESERDLAKPYSSQAEADDASSPQPGPESPVDGG